MVMEVLDTTGQTCHLYFFHLALVEAAEASVVAALAAEASEGEVLAEAVEDVLVAAVQEVAGSMKDKLITILGPTASGKTTFAANLAHSIDGEIISADSRQIYRGIDIGT